MGGDHLQKLTQTNFTTSGSLAGLTFSSSTTSNDPPSSRCDGLFFLDYDQLMCLKQCCYNGPTSTSSSPSSHVTMDDDRSPSYMINNCVMLRESMLPASMSAKNDQPLPAAQFDNKFVDPKDTYPRSISESNATNHQSSLQNSVSRQKILKKPKVTVAKRKIQGVKKCEHDGIKKPRNETISSLPLSNDNKVGRQKTGDRIARLQRLVSPLGKSDTASVLSECIEYIRFLHEQVSVLSTTYTATSIPPYTQSVQDLDDYFCDQSVLGSSSDPASLRSRGLCIAPVSAALWHTHDITWALGNKILSNDELSSARE